MRKSEFYDKLKEYLEIESIAALNHKTNLKELQEYSSLTIMLMIAFIDEFFQKKLTAKELINISLVDDLMVLVGNNNFVD